MYHSVALEGKAGGWYLLYEALASGGLASLILTIGSLVIDKQIILVTQIFKQVEVLR